MVADRPAGLGRTSGCVTPLGGVGRWAAAGFVNLGPGGRPDKLCVDPAHRCRGAAPTLLGTAEAEAVTQGVEGLHTKASLTARPLVEAAGFRVVAQESAIRNGRSLRRFRMRKEGLGVSPNPS